MTGTKPLGKPNLAGAHNLDLEWVKSVVIFFLRSVYAGKVPVRWP
ncbi:MAG: hypothetical protein WCF85_06500 [Rhodospirillaceae bacterium]